MIGWVARHWPFANGAGRLVDRLGRDVDCGHGIRVARTRDGFPMTVMAGDLIGRHLLITGRFDRSLFEILLRAACPGDHLLDVGANIGYVSCLVLNQVRGASVTAIEPQPDVANLLRDNVAQFGAGRAHVDEIALSDRAGEGHMTIQTGNRGGSALSDAGTTVRLVDAGAYLAAMDRVDLIKVDIEGHEETFFRAAAVQLVRLCPRAILFEDTAHAPGADGWIDEILSKAGYDVYGVRKSLLSTRLVPVDAGNRSRFHDYLAVSRARRHEIADLMARIA